MAGVLISLASLSTLPFWVSACLLQLGGSGSAQQEKVGSQGFQTEGICRMGSAVLREEGMLLCLEDV